jgi:hypothetical protein
MGEVHVARDEGLLRKVAFKRMVPEHFYQLESLLAGLAGAAGEALARGAAPGGPAPIYHDGALDLSPGPACGHPVSITSVVALGWSYVVVADLDRLLP